MTTAYIKDPKHFILLSETAVGLECFLFNHLNKTAKKVNPANYAFNEMEIADSHEVQKILESPEVVTEALEGLYAIHKTILLIQELT